MAKSIIVFISVFMAGLNRIMATDYYVSPTGTATWANCSGATPLNGTAACSWQTAMSSAAAGDMVYFRGGTYDVGIVGSQRDYANMRPTNSGTSGKPITFIAYPNEVPMITSTVIIGSKSAYFGCSYANYITWDGFSATMSGLYYNLDGSPTETWVWAAWSSDYCTLKNSDLSGIGINPIEKNISLIRLERTNYAVIENNYLHDLVSISVDAVNTTAIWLVGSNNINAAIRNNTIKNCEGGVYSKSNPNTSHHNNVYKNFIYNTSGTGMNGIYFNLVGPSNKIYSNIIVGYKTGIQATASVGYGTDSFYIYNNTIYSNNNTFDGIYVGPEDAPITGIEVFNNIVSNVTPLLRYYDGKVSYSDYNGFYTASGNIWNRNYATDYTLLSDWINSTGFDLYSITSDPLFASPGGSISSDYILQVNSPYLGAGIDRQDYDNDGNTTERINMGAYITGNEVIGYQTPDIQNPSDVAPPVRPRGLRIKTK